MISKQRRQCYSDFEWRESLPIAVIIYLFIAQPAFAAWDLARSSVFPGASNFSVLQRASNIKHTFHGNLGTVEDQERLIRDLSRGYNPLIRPVASLNQSVHVNFGIVLQLLISVNERDQVFKTNIWFKLGWQDPQLAWAPEKYGNIQSLRLPADKVWTPEIVLLNNADGKYGASYKSNAVIYSKGDVLWVPPSIYKSTCEINVVFFPFDIQTCKMRFRSWTWTAQELTLESLEEGNFVDLSDYTDSGTWDILEARGYPLYYYTDKEPKMEMVYQFVIRRRPLFYTVNLLIPTCLVTFLTVLVFYLPSASGEKVALSISISVVLVFFLLLVSKILPPSKDLPLMARYLLFAFIMNFISVTVTVCVIHMHFRNPKTDKAPPKAFQYIFFSFLPSMMMMRRPRRYRHLHQFSLRSMSIISLKARKQSSIAQSSPAGRLKGNGTSFQFDIAGKERIELFELDQLPHEEEKGGTQTVLPRNSLPFEYPIENVEEDPKEQGICMSALEIIINSFKKRDYVRHIEEDWKWVATVIDRGLLWIFFIVTSAGSLGILMREPQIFEYVRYSK